MAQMVVKDTDQLVPEWRQIPSLKFYGFLGHTYSESWIIHMMNKIKEAYIPVCFK